MSLAERDVTLAERDATLAERDVTLTVERTLRMSAEAGIQVGAGGRSGQPMQQASAGQPAADCRRKTA